MDWASVAIAGIAGGLGAGIGGIIGTLIPIRKAKKFTQIFFVIVGALVGSKFLEPQIEIQFGQSIREALGQKDLIEELRGQPLFARVFDDDPALESAVRERLVKARAQGYDSLVREIQQIGIEIGQSQAPKYFVLAQAGDLLETIRSISDVVITLAEDDPMLCTAWLFGGSNGQTYTLNQLIKVAGENRINKINLSLARLVENFFQQTPVYDEVRAQVLVEEAALAMVTVAGPEALPVIAEAVIPSNISIARAACKGVGELYSNLLNHDSEESAFALRHLFASN